MKKREHPDTGKNNLLGMDNRRAPVIYDLELLDNILQQLDELTQWCKDIESRLRWIEEAIMLSKSGMHIKVPQWYES